MNNDAQTELSGALTLILNRYVELISSASGDQWDADQERTVRQVRDVLTRAGHAPQLSREVRAHIDYRYLGAANTR
ncbi:MAG: hypothetical protein H7Y38_15220 [Armatimonadetes bacterium]|nr:hypothetical protein [Armatimonadota bacterium]